jgi:UDP-N-acetyl-D-glucosamine/UDP-N-acetyl-D-galactosamine dehydrogenase
MTSQRIVVLGLGYVGLPLATELARAFSVVGFDTEARRVAELQSGEDTICGVPAECLSQSTLAFSTAPEVLSSARYVFVCVPTPVDAAKGPDLTQLERATAMVGRHLRAGTTVVFESTVYPGATEQACVPILERESGLAWKRDFFVAYSPERINPGDQAHTLTQVVKVVAGDLPETATRVADVYRRIIAPGVYVAPSIVVAEMAKLLENSQRDLNIALMNEAALICHRLGIDTLDVLDTARTKWNFQAYHPGLVGGHCVGVDPYYLTHKAEQLGYHSEVVLAGRRINDGMPSYLAGQTVKHMAAAGRQVLGARVILLGVTFKEDCSDVRNSKVFELAVELREFGCEVSFHDPLASSGDVLREYGVRLTAWQDLPRSVDGLILAVPHQEYRLRPQGDYLALLRPGGLIVDVRGLFPRELARERGMQLFRL